MCLILRICERLATAGQEVGDTEGRGQVSGSGWVAVYGSRTNRKRGGQKGRRKETMSLVLNMLTLRFLGTSL